MAFSGGIEWFRVRISGMSQADNEKEIFVYRFRQENDEKFRRKIYSFHCQIRKGIH